MALKEFVVDFCPDENCPGQGAYHEHTIYMDVWDEDEEDG